MIPGRNRRGGFKRRATASGVDLEPAFIQNITDLWTWHWAGVAGSRLTLSGDQITQVEDISGNGNHYVAEDPPNGDLDYQSDLFLTDGASVLYDLLYPALLKHRLNSNRSTLAQGTDRFPAGFAYSNNFVATGEFCLIGIGIFSRTSGTREYWGFDTTNNVAIEQSTNTNRVKVVIGGAAQTNISNATGASGIAVVEVFRDSLSDWNVIWNGTDISLSTKYNNAATFTLTGFGYDQTPSSRFDDFWLEDMSFLGSVPTAQERTDIRNSLLTKWTNQA